MRINDRILCLVPWASGLRNFQSHESRVRSHIIFILLGFLISGCTTEYNLATQQQETLLYDTDKEIAMGDSISQGVEKKYPPIEDVDLNERIERVLKRIVEVCDRTELVYFIKVLDDDMVNAISLPGGYVYIFRGLMDKLKTDDQLAAVIGHEIGHITAKHAVKKLQAAYGALLVQAASYQAGGGRVAQGVGLALASIFMEHSQQDEFQADRLGVKYMKKAGFNTQGMVDVIRILRKEQQRAEPHQFSYWRTHPYLSQREAVVSQEIKGKMEYQEYIKLIGDSK